MLFPYNHINIQIVFDDKRREFSFIVAQPIHKSTVCVCFPYFLILRSFLWVNIKRVFSHFAFFLITSVCQLTNFHFRDIGSFALCYYDSCKYLRNLFSYAIRILKFLSDANIFFADSFICTQNVKKFCRNFVKVSYPRNDFVWQGEKENIHQTCSNAKKLITLMISLMSHFCSNSPWRSHKFN